MEIIALYSNDKYLQATIDFLKIHDFIGAEKVEIYPTKIYVQFIDESWIEVSKRMLESHYMDKGESWKI